MNATRACLLALLALCAGCVGGCGSSRPDSARTSGAGHTHAVGEVGAVAVIRDWSNALARGDVGAAAGYFAIPSLFANGAGANGQLAVVKIESRAQARVINASLSCGARLTSAHKQGRYIVAAFRLIDRSGPGAGCGSGAGETASTYFLIRHGRIVEWIRAPAGITQRELPAPPANPQSSGAEV